MSKKSIRFFNDREVRAVWDEEHSKWWFSATDIVRAINNEDDYKKCRNYWKYLKGKMAKDGIELVSVTNHFKFHAPDGKQRAADALDAECVQTLAKNYPNNRARKFLEWFTYSDNSIDGQSKKKAYTLIESDLLDSMEPGTVKCLQQIHAYLFGGLYDFAGQIRTKTIAKGNTLFCLAEHLHSYLKTVETMPETSFDEIVDKYVEMNAAHPFMEGNGKNSFDVCQTTICSEQKPCLLLPSYEHLRVSCMLYQCCCKHLKVQQIKYLPYHVRFLNVQHQ